MNNKQIKIGNIFIGEDKPIYLIAEIGINHNGDIQTAKKLMDAAFATGWNCVKYQKRTPDICVPEAQKKVLRQTIWGEMTYLEYKHKIEFGKEQYDYIDIYCKEKPIDWSVSVWDIPSLEFILKYNIPFIKIPSAKITDINILTECAKSGKPVFCSTGMSTIEEIDKAVEILEKYSNNNYVLFHTNSTYPTKPEELNLLAIRTLKERYQCLIGYSGHEFDLEPSIITATLGVSVIERHVTLDHNMWGSDHFASLEVQGMDKLKRRIDSIYQIMGDGIKRPTKSEEEIKKKLRG
ncbi:MAG: N-acetylneuraminate synthase family protein [Spirochaetes bacterium]|nr:N-acetylneuraminate synthase family protein [Spirochaetota bacterium]